MNEYVVISGTLSGMKIGAETRREAALILRELRKQKQEEPEETDLGIGVPKVDEIEEEL